MPTLPQIPEIKTQLPGPRAGAFVARDAAVVSSSYTRSYPLVIELGEDCMVRDVDGNIFLDYAAGIAVNATGHRHPAVVKAIKAGLDDGFIHMSGTDFYYAEQIEYAERLAKAVDGDEPMSVFFANSGAEAIEAALKLARWSTKRTNIISMQGAFHGRTLGALSVGNSKAIHRQHFHPLVAGMHHARFPDTLRGMREGQSEAELVEECLDTIRKGIFKREVEPSQVAAILVEPIQGEGGYLVPPAGFLAGLRTICDEHGIVLIFDEVQAGFGRTGELFAHFHEGVKPDIIALAKGIASGMPLGAIVAKKSIMTWPPGTHASTFGGNPLACRAASATLDLLEGELCDNAKAVGAYLKEGLERELLPDPRVAEVRGRGLMLALDFAKPNSLEGDAELRNKVVDAAFERGLLVLGCGANALRLCPALTTTREHADCALAILKASLASIA